MMPSAVPDPALQQVFRQIRADARSQPTTPNAPTPFPVDFVFDGAGQQPTVGDVLVFPVGRLAARLIGAELVADQAGSASIDIALGNMSSWPASSPIYDVRPTMVSAAAIEIDITNWQKLIQPFDILVARLVTVGTPITSITLCLSFVRLDYPPSSNLVTTGSGGTVVTNVGDNVIIRQ